MKTRKEIVLEIEKLFNEYSKEVHAAEIQKLLTSKTANTYLLHPANFIRWIKDDFTPGNKNR